MKVGMFRHRCKFVTGVARNATPLFCHHATRGGRKHTGKKRKLEIAEGVVNILQCNVTTWSGDARHYILASDFDAALISETHLGREKMVTAGKEARTFSWAGTGSATISTANNGTSAGVLALVRTRWFPKPLSICTPSQDRQGGSYVSWVGRFCCLQLISSTPSFSAAISTPI